LQEKTLDESLAMIDEYQKQAFEKNQRAIDREIDQSKQRHQTLTALAATGSEDAKKNWPMRNRTQHG